MAKQVIGPKQAAPQFDWDRLSELISQGEGAPPGSITRKEFAKKMKLSETSSRRILDNLVESGQMERGTFRVSGTNRSKVMWYRWKSK